MSQSTPLSPARQLLAGLRAPHEEFSFAPFWFWNDKLDPKELARQLRAMKDQGLDQAVVHARLGLRVDYLSEQWFACVEHAIQCAKRLGMKLWLYDENNWPSGCAGGRVLERYPQGRSRHMVLKQCTGHDLMTIPLTLVPEGELIAALLVSPDGAEVRDISDQIRYCQIHCDAPGPDWKLYFILERLDKRCHPLALPYQTDCLDPQVIDLFIELTHEEYFRRFGEEFGKTILGFFTDEPGLYYNLANQQPGSLPWTPGFLDVFKESRGYDLKLRLPWLWEEGPLTAQTRQDFWQTVAERFCEVFFKKQRQWCDAHGVQMIGHLEWEEYLSTQIQFLGDLFSPMRHLHRAGLDRIDMNFHKLTEKYASSVQHTTPGLTRTMSESFALTGWDVTLERLRRIINWQYARGVNFIIPHAFFYSIRGMRVNEAPPSHFFQNTFWPWFKQLADYTKRLGYVLCQGRFEAPFAVYYPIHAARRRYDPNRVPGAEDLALTEVRNSSTHELDQTLLAVTEQIEHLQSDFDFVDDEALRGAKYLKDVIQIAAQAYRAIVVVGWNDVPRPIQTRLLQWSRKGGLLITWQLADSPPLPQEPLTPNHLACRDLAELGRIIARRQLRVAELADPRPQVRVMRRSLGQDTLFMLNNEADIGCAFTLKVSDYAAAFVIDCQTGAWWPMPIVPSKKGPVVKQVLEAHEASVLLLTREAIPDVPGEEGRVPGRALATLEGPWRIEIEGATQKSTLKPWGQLGHPWLSGTATYQKTFVLEADLAANDLWLDLGEVREIAEVFVDECAVGTSVWAPRRLRLPELAPGKHRLSIRVTNTPINALARTERVSGLLGPVRLMTV